MGLIFRHTAKERGLWRGWLRNGQSVEISTQRSGWAFGGGIHIHSDDDDRGSRMIFVKFWRLTVIVPIGVVPGPYVVGDEPQWSVYVAKEFGLTAHWGLRRWSRDLPGALFTVEYQQQMPDGSWSSVFNYSDKPYSESHPYTYVLKSGEVQDRTATISKRRHIMGRRFLHHLGWPKRIKESLDVNFDGEVGEESGSWKGGCLGCGWTMLPGEAMADALKRMEATRRFDR